jgi:lipopolysaccharide/colanic/teichoic acid biosynthesis glycosyltransferase
LEQSFRDTGLGEINSPCGSLHSGVSKDTSPFVTCIAKPPASKWVLSHSRRMVDIAVSLIVLLLAAAPMLLLAVCIRLSSKGNVFFSQQRVGVKGRLFTVYKFRSMAHTANEKNGPGLTKDGDGRITPLGRLMRRFKLDELPQFYNVLRGDMSLVGPRPKLPQFAALLNMPYRPGITGPATLAFQREEEMLRNVETSELENFYALEIKPVKARLDACYMCQASPTSDARIVGATALGCLHLDPAILHLPAALIQVRTMMSNEVNPKMPHTQLEKPAAYGPGN